jgi:hypothetical protein
VGVILGIKSTTVNIPLPIELIIQVDSISQSVYPSTASRQTFLLTGQMAPGYLYKTVDFPLVIGTSINENVWEMYSASVFRTCPENLQTGLVLW